MAQDSHQSGDQVTAGHPQSASRFVLLGDRPAVGGEDRLGFDVLAEQLAALVFGSRESTPFTLGIDAGWGMGKTSLLERLRGHLCPDPRDGGTGHTGRTAVRVVDFNPWSARDGHVLEGLTKTILREVEGQLRQVLRSDRTLKGLRSASLLAASPFGFGKAVDSLWDLVARDPVARNQLRVVVAEALRKWLDDGPDRLLCVFIDDLDRCSPKAVFELFEAMKVHLDAPGLTYVIAYDKEIVSNEVFAAEGYPEGITNREYLEKIIQVIYRIPARTDETRRGLVGALLESSATAGLVGHLRNELSLWSEDNPRRLKRIINTAIVTCDPDAPDADRATQLAEAVLAMYYPQLSETGKKQTSRRDEYVAYATVRPALARDAQPPPELESVLDWVIEHWDLRHDLTGRALLAALEDAVGTQFVELAWDPRLASLVGTMAPKATADIADGVGDDDGRLRARDWRSEVPDEDARRVLTALLNPTHEFRTARGLAADASVPEEEILSIVKAYPQFARQSRVPNSRGEALFAARPALQAADDASRPG